MKVEGIFEVKLEPVVDDLPSVGRMIIHKKYEGSVRGIGVGQMISKRTDNGVAIYSAIEEFEGKVEGRSGAFTMVHNGYMSNQRQNLIIEIVEGSGSGELKTISGSMSILVEDGKHYYQLDYKL